MIENFYSKLTARWVARAKVQGLKAGSKKYADAQLEFFIGGTTAADLINPEHLGGMALLALSVGQDSRDIWPTYMEFVE